MILAIDAGNTRIKWGVRSEGAWIRGGVCAVGQADELASRWIELGELQQILVANVAGVPVHDAILAAAKRFATAPEFIASRAVQCGVRSSYDPPEQLGCDRWAALIGARRLYPGACLVVNAGTAMTVDALSEDGIFLGGIIVPGLDLMRRALDAHTALLRWQPGAVRFFPNNTGDAIVSGAAHALTGAIERMAGFMRESGQERLRVILSGGSSEALHPFIAAETLTVDNLVLEGLAVIGEEGD
jgi:type III pantothenate kinase